MSDKTITGVVTWLRNWFYTKTEVDSLISTSGGTISIEDTDLFDVLDCVNNNFDSFAENVLYNPSLDGTEAITTISTYTPSISDGVLTNGCGYLTDGWDNTVDWELTFEYYVTGDNNGYLVIPQGTTSRDYNGVQQWQNKQLNFRVQGSSPSGNISNAGLSTNTWINVRITKVGYVWTVYYNDTQVTSWDSSSYSSIVDTWTTMCIGLDKNASSRYASIRNIIVKEI